MNKQTIEKRSFSIHYGKAVEEEISKLASKIEKNEHLTSCFESRWLAIKLIESDSNILEKITAIENTNEVVESSMKSIVTSFNSVKSV